MNKYIQLLFSTVEEEVKNILIAELSELGYEGFEESENGLKAFITQNKFVETDVVTLSSKHGVRFDVTVIEETNWNDVWESNFEPVVVDEFVAIRADFHKPIAGVEYELVITPKMSFGTGHHATTHMMIQQMKSIEFKGKSVFDFGTGTGVLAILAEKLGAEQVLAIDIDEWSIRNAEENITRNGAGRIQLRQASDAATGRTFDIVLANINKNVIIGNFMQLVNQLLPGGVMVLSGLVSEDKDDIFHICNEYSLQIWDSRVKDNWLCIRVSR